MEAPTFNFFHHWYPIVPLEDLDPEHPTAVVLLGQRMVIWKPRFDDQYRVFLDQCPHRLAPLSEGRVDEKTGNLLCSYHGWQFDATGTCTHIPQAENPEILSKNRDQYCVTALPSQEANGLLWVWPDPSSATIAFEHPLPLSPQIDASQGFVWSSMVRDLEYDWQTLVENVADPAHVPFAHHGIQGNRSRATPLPIKIVESTPTRIEAKIEGNIQTQITFTPPCHLEYTIRFGGDRQVGLVTYCLPVAPGKSRIVAQFPRNFAQRLHHWTPRWWNHIAVRNSVLDGDMVLLHLQERDLQQKAKSDPPEHWTSLYKLPTSADRLVIEFRRWWDRYGQEALPWNLYTDSPLPTLDRQHLLDRYHQHTRLCSSCRQALTRIQQLQIALVGYFVIALSIAALLPDSARFAVGLPLLGSALLGLGLYGGLKYGLEPKFYFVDYIHADRK